MHYKKLDALRGISILMVIIGHWLALRQLHLANMGVEIFFVLSGFLITLILLKNKSAVSDKSSFAKTGSVLKKFYIRRFLRIFPVYYLVLIVCLFSSYPNDFLKNEFLWDIFYLNNIYSWYYNIQTPNFVHLWSLSVEEQFYLVWPLLVLLTPKSHLKLLFSSTVILGILFRVIYFSKYLGLSQSRPMGIILLPACMDMFAWGALVAYYHLYQLDKIAQIGKSIAWLFLFGLAIVAATIFFQNGWGINVFFRIGSSLMALSLIIQCIEKTGGIQERILTNPFLLYLGKISYGLYLLHLLISDALFVRLFTFLAGHEPRFVYILPARFLLLLALASLSWHLFEKPINNLKDRLAPYTTPSW